MTQEFKLIKKFNFDLELRKGKNIYQLYMRSTDSSLFLSQYDINDLKEYFTKK